MISRGRSGILKAACICLLLPRWHEIGTVMQADGLELVALIARERHLCHEGLDVADPHHGPANGNKFACNFNSHDELSVPIRLAFRLRNCVSGSKFNRLRL
jgi:hypothetical protein